MSKCSVGVGKEDVQLNRGLYFDRPTINDIVKMEFCPGTPTAYLNLANKEYSPLSVNIELETRLQRYIPKKKR